MKTAQNDRHLLTIHIPAYNCPDILDACLQRLSWADEIIVQDASSDRRVGELIELKYPHVKRVVDTEPDIRRRLLNWHKTGIGDYILWVQTDEMYSEELGHEILTALRRPCVHDAFQIPSVDVSFGENFGEGGSQMRLFHRDRFHFPLKSIHEMPVVAGSIGALRYRYTHVNNPFFFIIAYKHFRYERVNAREMDEPALQRLSLDHRGWRFIWRAALQWGHINWVLWRNFLHYRRHGYAGLCMSYGAMMWQMARWMSATEELRIRSGKAIRGDTRGYLDS